MTLDVCKKFKVKKNNNKKLKKYINVKVLLSGLHSPWHFYFMES